MRRSKSSLSGRDAQNVLLWMRNIAQTSRRWITTRSAKSRSLRSTAGIVTRTPANGSGSPILSVIGKRTRSPKYSRSGALTVITRLSSVGLIPTGAVGSGHVKVATTIRGSHGRSPDSSPLGSVGVGFVLDRLSLAAVRASRGCLGHDGKHNTLKNRTSLSRCCVRTYDISRRVRCENREQPSS